jgi:phosphocarrier protein HPr
MQRLQVTIDNRLGLHARAAAKFVKLASSFAAEVTLARGEQRVNGKSIMGVMMLAAGKGTTLELCTEGPEEDAALAALAALVEDRFGEGE